MFSAELVRKVLWSAQILKLEHQPAVKQGMTETMNRLDDTPLAEQPYQLLPPLNPDEYAALKEDISERGVLVAIEFDEEGNILDGHHRYQICVELGITDFPKVVRAGWTEAQKRSHARSLNVHRRHLNQEQRRALIAEELLENPAASNNSIAKRLGVSDVTVAAVRQGLGEEAKSEMVLGADGKYYPAKRPVVEAASPEEVEKSTSFLTDFLNISADSADSEDRVERSAEEDHPMELSGDKDRLIVKYSLTVDQHDLVIDAVANAKKAFDLSTSQDALVRICEMYLQSKEANYDEEAL